MRWLLLAAAAGPSLVFGGLLAWAGAGGPAFPLTPAVGIALWLLLTLPPALAVMALRGRAAPSHEREIRDALAAIERAERLMDAHAVRLASVSASAGGRPGWAAVGGAFALGALLMGAGWVLAAHAPWSSEPPIHIHATIAVFDGSERIAFSDAYYDLSARRYLHAHLHAPNQDVIHVEGPGPLALERIFARGLDATLGPEGLVLHGPVHQERALLSNATHAWRLQVAPAGGDVWEDVARPWAYVPADHDRLLLVLAGPGEDLESKRAAVSRVFPVEG